MRLNVRAPHGRVRVQITDELGVPLTGYTFEDCAPFQGDKLFWTPE